MSAYKTLKITKVLSDLTKTRRIITLLQTAFPMLANVITGVRGAMAAGFTATQTFKVALSGLFDIIKAHPVMATIAAVTSAIVVFTNFKQAAEEQAEKSKEAADNATEEANSIADLIKQYKELKSSGKRDTETISQIRDIQNQITKLTGLQNTNLDLVNGSLDKELEKLKKIGKEQAQNNLSTYEKNVDDAIGKQNFEDAKIFNYVDGVKYIRPDWKTIDTGNDEERVKDIISSIEGVSDISDVHHINLDSNIDSYSKISEIIGNIVAKLEENFKTSEDSGIHNLWSSLVTSKQKIDKMIGEVQTSYQSLTDNLFISGDYADTDITSLEDFSELRDKIIKDLSNNERIKNGLEKGFIDENWINNQVNTYLAGLDNFSDYYNEWYNKFGSDVAKSVNDLKDKLKLDVYFFEPENLSNGKNDTIEKWFNNLTDKQKDIIVKIQAQFETDDWSFEKWQEEVKNWKTPEKDKINFSDLIETEDFQDKVKYYKDNITSLVDALKKLHSDELSESDKIELFENFPELASQADNLDEAIVNLVNSFKTDTIDTFNEKLGYMKTNDDVKALNALKDSILNLASETNEISKTTDEIEKLKGTLSDLKGTYDSITGIIDDYNENGYYTIDNLKSLLELEPAYINALIDENGQINLNSQSYRNYVAAKAKTLVVDQIKSLYENILAMSKEEVQAYANATAYKAESDSLEDLITTTTQYYMVLARAKDAENNTTVYTEGLQKSFGTVANYAAVYNSWLNSLNSSTNEFANKTNGATSALETQKDVLESQKSALQDYKDGLEDAKDALEDYKDSLEGAQDDIQSLIDLTIDYIKQTKENEKSALQDSIDSLEDKKSALDDQKDAYSKLISKRKEEIEALYEEKKAQDELSEKQKSAAKDALSLAIAQLDDSSAGKKAQKQAQDNYAASNKDLKDYLGEQAKDKRIAALEEDEKANEEMIERRKAAIDAQVEHLESKIDEIDAYLDNSRKLYEDACNMIDNDNGTLYSNLWNYTYTYTTKTRAEFDYLWSSAQAAIQRYKGDNDTLISTMEILQGKIYDTDRQIENLNGQIDDCETQISNLDSAISSTSNAINSTSGAIDNVSSSLGGLSSNIERYKKALDELTKANNNGGDIPSNAKWTFDYTDKNGDIRTAWSTSKDFETAVRDIQSIIEKETGYYRPDVFGGIKKRYASGTRNSSGGVSITQEDGFEAIFGKLSSGQYTMMPQGSQVFTAAQTDNLYGFASNPQKFISDVIGKMSSFLSSSYGNFADSVRGVTNKVTKYGGDMTFSSAPVYHIYGKVDNDTLNKMDKQEKQRYELFKKQFMLEMLREKNNL